MVSFVNHRKRCTVFTPSESIRIFFVDSPITRYYLLKNSVSPIRRSGKIDLNPLQIANPVFGFSAAAVKGNGSLTDLNQKKLETAKN